MDSVRRHAHLDELTRGAAACCALPINDTLVAAWLEAALLGSDDGGGCLECGEENGSTRRERAGRIPCCGRDGHGLGRLRFRRDGLVGVDDQHRVRGSADDRDCDHDHGDGTVRLRDAEYGLWLELDDVPRDP